jgi:hypothetical protein
MRDPAVFHPLSVFFVYVYQTSHWPAGVCKKTPYVDRKKHTDADLLISNKRLCLTQQQHRSALPRRIEADNPSPRACSRQPDLAQLSSCIAPRTVLSDVPCSFRTKSRLIHDLPSARVQDLGSCPYARVPYRNTSRQVRRYEFSPTSYAAGACILAVHPISEAHIYLSAWMLIVPFVALERPDPH